MILKIRNKMKAYLLGAVAGLMVMSPVNAEVRYPDLLEIAKVSSEVGSGHENLLKSLKVNTVQDQELTGKWVFSVTKQDFFASPNVDVMTTEVKGDKVLASELELKDRANNELFYVGFLEIESPTKARMVIPAFNNLTLPLKDFAVEGEEMSWRTFRNDVKGEVYIGNDHTRTRATLFKDKTVISGVSEVNKLLASSMQIKVISKKEDLKDALKPDDKALKVPFERDIKMANYKFVATKISEDDFKKLSSQKFIPQVPHHLVSLKNSVLVDQSLAQMQYMFDEISKSKN